MPANREGMLSVATEDALEQVECEQGAPPSRCQRGSIAPARPFALLLRALACSLALAGGAALLAARARPPVEHGATLKGVSSSSADFDIANLVWHGNTSQCFDVDGGKAKRGTRLQLWTCNESPDMQLIIPTVSGMIRWAAHPDLCARPAGSSVEMGAELILWECEDGREDMQWIMPVGPGPIRNRHAPHLCIHAKPGAKDGDPAILGKCPAEVHGRWTCHDYAAHQDNAWCAKGGDAGQWEYGYFGPESPCGPCWCCKRLKGNCSIAEQGCFNLKTESQCTQSQDGRDWVRDQPCVWCGRENCTSGASSRCEPMDWLLNGEGRWFTKFLGKDDYRVSTCHATPPVVWEVKPLAGPHSLYCWVCMVNGGSEPALMSLQQRRGLGIFACDAHVAFSSTGGDINGINTVALGPDPTHMCTWGETVHYACNTKIFIKAWEKLVELGEYRRYAWTVKVDPDAAFFPGRLKQHLAPLGDNGLIFIQNAEFPKMLGPIEVVSRLAVDKFGRLRQACYDRLDEDVTGEDGYFSDCFFQVLGAEAHADFGLLSNCNDAGQCGGGAVAYHAMKSEGALDGCYSRAM